MLSEDLSVFYSANDFGEVVTVQGATVTAIFNERGEVVLGEAVVQEPTLELPASVVAAEGGVCVVRGTTYRIRQVLDQPPDGAVRLLVLAEV